MNKSSSSLVHVLWFCVFAYALFIFWLSSVSQVPDGGQALPLGDKLFHFALYFFFGILIYLAMRHTWRKTPANHLIMFTLFAVVLYALTDELHQSFVSARNPSIWDVAADGLGGFFGALAANVKWRRRHAR